MKRLRLSKPVSRQVWLILAYALCIWRGELKIKKTP